MRQGKRATPDQRSVFLAALCEGATVGAAADRAGVSRQAAYRWRDDADFAAQWDQAFTRGTETLEDEARRRAVDGVDEPVGWYQGEPGGTVRKYSDTLLIFLLKGRKPETYRDRTELSGPGGGPIATEDFTELTPVERAQRLAAILAAQGAAGG